MRGNGALYTSDTAEHYTPGDVLDLVVEVMGGIDLDPCADPGRRVPAAAHYTAEVDGLRRPWSGRVFMNPPYGRNIGAWVDRLVEAHAAGCGSWAMREVRRFPLPFAIWAATVIGS